MTDPITYSQIPDVVIRKRNWSEKELREMGYEYFARRKEITMIRVLPDEEAPLNIVTSWGDDLVAKAGYIICYEPGPIVRDKRDAYSHWPVEPTIFYKTYEEWDEPDWQPTPAEQSLLDFGCKPYYKTTGIWAKKLTYDAYLQSMEHEKPIRVATGRYVAIGVDGEPYSMGASTIAERYKKARPPQKGLWQRLKKLFGF